MVDDPKELGKKIKNGEDHIEIEYNLGKKIAKIKATGNVAWAITLSSIGIAITAMYLTIGSGGTSGPATAPFFAITGTTAASTLGVPTATAAVLIGVSGGGVVALKKIRKYKLIEKNNYYVLEKR